MSKALSLPGRKEGRTFTHPWQPPRLVFLSWLSGLTWCELMLPPYAAMVLHNSVATAHDGCRFGWAALIPTCLRDNMKDIPVAGGVPVQAHSHELHAAFMHQRTALVGIPLDPRLCPCDGSEDVRVSLVGLSGTGLSRMLGCPWDVRMSLGVIGNVKLHSPLRFRMGSDLLPREQGRHVGLPRSRRAFLLLHRCLG